MVAFMKVDATYPTNIAIVNYCLPIGCQAFNFRIGHNFHALQTFVMIRLWQKPRDIFLQARRLKRIKSRKANNH